MFIVGGAIGAGFVTGAELVRFFSTRGFWLSCALSSAIFSAMCMLFLHLGKKYGGAEKVFSVLFGRGKRVARVLVSLCAFIPSAGMLAGLDALVPACSPLLSILGLVVATVCLHRGMKGVANFNAVLVPALLISVLLFSKMGRTFSVPIFFMRGIFGGIVYAGMNAFLLATVLFDAGEKMKKPLLSCLLSGVLVFFAAGLILARVAAGGKEAEGAEMPFLSVVNSRIFDVTVAAAILTSLVSSLYPIRSLCGVVRGKKRYAAEGLSLLAAFAFSRLGLYGIVRFFYPILGFLGCGLSILCILHEQLFEHRHKKIHERGKEAKDHRRRHQKVEFEHLPAIHDKVSEPRTGHNIFPHNGADPCHPHVDFEHGDKRGERGRHDEFA